MTKTKWFRSLLCLLTLVFFIGQSTPILAETMGSVSISKMRNAGEGKSVPVSGSTYALARVDDGNGIVDAAAEVLNKDKAEQILTELSSLTLTDLQKRATNQTLYYSNPTDADGRTTVNSLTGGLYYIVEVSKDTKGEWQRTSTSVPSLIFVEVGRVSTIAIKNKDLPKPDATTYKVKKVWKGKELSSVTVNLKQNGTIIDSVVLNADNNWEHTFTNLTKVDSDGSAYTYTVEEEVPDKFTATYEQMANKSGTIITNTYTPPTPPGTPILKTGTLGIFWLIGIAVILIGIGYKLYRTDEK
ncbi:TPA: Cna B-type domain-containing protein [Streptococcus suis]|nr:Cna B-type domain-containing protein [Streptococcus suis]HEM5185673.1 Cna B-type domain-containing protein [Streptococcus suis]HEM5274576.1 Cna B-type domain-containing protein [Streptococcus suis]HEM5280335.1 Cna B-type domain-containing protein [Streptococcus suis]